MTAQTTKNRILDAAEELFAKHGYDGTSLRGVTGAAEVNLAAVHYHFGGKLNLFQAVFERRVGGINEERLRLLDEIEARATSEPVPLEEVLEAFFGPALHMAMEGDPGHMRFMQIVGRANSATGEHLAAIKEVFQEIHDRFIPVFRRSLPELGMKDLFWRMHFLIGSMCLVMADPHRIDHVSGGLCASHAPEETLRQLIAFAVGALRAAPVDGGPSDDPSRKEGEQ
jgi:AcrR family transcriptional regulator